MWVTKTEYEKIVQERDELKKQMEFLCEFYGELVEDAFTDDVQFTERSRTSRMIHPSLKGLLLSGFNRGLRAIGSTKQFKYENNTYIR